jgi:tetratricopeptide (TPR) repeat protein
LNGAWLACVVLLAPPGERAPKADSEAAAAESAGAEPGSEQRSPAYADVLEPVPEDQRDEAAAKQLMASAKAAFRDERFEEAIEFLAEAYRTYPYVTLLYSLGSAHRRAYEQGGDIEHRRLSVRRYQQYLSAAPDAEYADLAQNYLTALLAERDLGELEAEVVTRILVSTPAEDATMILDGGAPLPAPGVLAVDPGAHEILVRAPGYRDYRRSIEVPEGTTYQIQAELEDRPADIAVEGPKGAWVRLDGRVIGRLPLNHAVSVEPGVHVVGVAKNGHEPHTEDLELERDGSQVVRADLRVSNQRVASYFLMGLGGAGLVTGAIQLGLALERQHQAQSLADQRLADQLSTQEYERYVEFLDQRNALRMGATIAGLAGGALLVTGVVLFAYDNPQAARRRGLRAVAPMLGPGSAGLVTSLRF